MPRTISICQNRTCRRAGSQKVLQAFRDAVGSEIEVIGCGCLGQCGNGPMVLIQPDLIWYSGVTLDRVPLIIKQHLLDSCH